MNASPDEKSSRITQILYGSGGIGFRISGISNAVRQSPNEVRAIHVLMGILLSLLMVGGFIFSFVHPLSREKYTLVWEQLAERANLIWSYTFEGGVGLFGRAAHAQTNQQFI